VYLPRALARFNRYVTNPIQRRWAGRLPGYGIIEHVGRKSGRTYRTPVSAFRASPTAADAGAAGFVVLIGYGVQSDWVRNLLAAGGGHLVHRRARYVLTAPRIVTGTQGRSALPPALRLLSRLARVDTVLLVSATRE
jgi:deazaflavin-dependent oxidoreductase (nitroreductase family)